MQIFGSKLESFLLTPRKFKALFPHDLDSLVEINDWHLGQSVAEHSQATLKAARALAKGVMPTAELRDLGGDIERYLSSAVGAAPRSQLLAAASLVHDVGKIDVMHTDENGLTSAPNHALRSAERLARCIGALRLGAEEVAYITSVVRAHHDIDSVFEADGTSLANFEEAHSGLAADLLLFYVADYEGCRTCTHIGEQKSRDYRMVAKALALWLKQ